MPPAFTRPPLSALVAALGLALLAPGPARATDFIEAELHDFGIATGATSTFMAFPDVRRGERRMYLQRLDEFGVPQWPDTGVQVGIGGHREVWPMVAADAQGGAWVAWQSRDDTNGVNVKLASFAKDGHRRWLTVLPMRSRSRANFSRPVAMFPGPGGSLTLVYADDFTSGSWMQRFDTAGAPILPGSGVALPLGSVADIHGRLVSDDAGGVFVLEGYGDVYLDHVDAAGAHAWGTPGVRVNGLEPASAPRVLTDGHGGAFVAWVAGVADLFHPSHSPVRVQHVAADGSLLWDPAGLRVSDQPADSPVLVSDGQGGVIAIAMGASWASYTYAQRFSSSGERAWGDGGILLALTSQLPVEPMIASDPAGGALLLWIGSGNMLRAQHLNADGRLALPQAGKPILELPANTFETIGVPDGVGGIVIGSGFVFAPFTARRIASTGDLLWPSDGSAVFGGVDRQLAPRSIPDGAGGVIVAWTQIRRGVPKITLQGYDAAGAPRWPARSIARPSSSFPDFALASDGAGGAIVAWVPEFAALSGGHPYGQRIDAFGRVRWGDGGIELTPGETLRLNNFGLVGDGAGGAILSWAVSVPQYANDLRDIRLQRFDGDGVSLWGEGGLQIPEVSATDFGARDQRLVADDAGGVATVYMQPFGATSAYSELRARAIDSAGQTRWTTDLALRDRYDTNAPKVARTLGGDLVIAWTDSSTVQRAQRLDPTGAPRWAQGGIELARTSRIPTHTYDYFQSLALVNDGADGAIASWYEFHSASNCPQCAMLRHVVALDAEGRPRWGAAGVPVPNAGSSNVALAADRSLGAWFAWGDSANLSSARLQHVDAAGAPLLGARGIEPGLPTSTQPNPAIAPDGAGGVFISWEDQPDRMHAQVHTQHFAADGTRLWAADATSDRALAPGATGAGLALESVWPNPSQGHWQAVISLADGSPVTLELVDIAGRLVHRATVTGLLPGRQSIAFDRPAGLRPGLYLLRVTQGGHATSRKVAFVP